MTRTARLDLCCPGLTPGNHPKRAEDDPIAAGLQMEVAVNLKKPAREFCQKEPLVSCLGAVS